MPHAQFALQWLSNPRSDASISLSNKTTQRSRMTLVLNYHRRNISRGTRKKKEPLAPEIRRTPIIIHRSFSPRVSQRILRARRSTNRPNPLPLDPNERKSKSKWTGAAPSQKHRWATHLLRVPSEQQGSSKGLLRWKRRRRVWSVSEWSSAGKNGAKEEEKSPAKKVFQVDFRLCQS